MNHLEQQCIDIQNVMYHYYDKHAFDRVSDADDQRKPLDICNESKNVQNENSDTNHIDNADRKETQARDQLTSNR